MPPLFRLATPVDAEQVLAIYAPYCLTPTSFESGPPTVDEMRQRITKLAAAYPWLVCEDSGEVTGYVYACPHRERASYRWSVDTSVYVRTQRQRRGLGRALYTALLDVLRLQGYVNAYAGVTLPNPSSVGLHEAMGFRPVGVYHQVGFKRGAWHDVGWFEKLLQPRPSQPAPPRPVRDVAHLPAWEAALTAGLSLLRV
jgi:phosphinothricin acetyltransferase